MILHFNLSVSSAEGMIQYVQKKKFSCVFLVLLNVFIVDTLPFGGVGQSGFGRYRGKFGFDTFSNNKALLIRSFFADALFA